MIQNPILRGFCPDPSIIRAGDDYYIATSTFEWWPGVKLFHSKDLKHWEQIRSPLRRKTQLDMVGNPTSGGVWAPCLSYDGERFFLVYTDVKTKKGKFYNTHNYVVYTDDIYGEWSEPTYLNSIGFDPSLFHDTDGKKYLINMVNGFRGILVQEIDPVTLQLVGERKKVYNGSGIGYTEGPHMYHIGDWYYLLTAEGGTGYDHCVTMARAKSIWGPFETAPDNPILTSNREDMDALQKCGHADFVDTPSGEWYMVHLCSRPMKGQQWCTLGRETAIQKMYWDKDAWLRLEGGGKFAAMQTKEPNGVLPLAFDDEENGFCDEFESAELHVRYSSPRIDYKQFADCKVRKGYLRLTGCESINSLHKVALVAVRQQRACCTAQTTVEFSPDYPEQLAGIAYMYDAMNYYLFGKTATEDGEPVLTLVKCDTGMVTEEISQIPLPKNTALELKVEVKDEGTAACFWYRFRGEEWKQAGAAQTTQILTDEHCRGFTGAHFGLYCHDMTGLAYHADFDYMEIK